MQFILMMLAAWGLCFGLQHKVPFLHGKSQFIDKMLACTFCTGFHAGYMVCLLWMGSQLSVKGDSVLQIQLSALMGQGVAFLCEGLLYAFASGAFCYMADTWTRYLESNSEPIELEEEEA